MVTFGLFHDNPEMIKLHGWAQTIISMDKKITHGALVLPISNKSQGAHFMLCPKRTIEGKLGRNLCCVALIWL